jgi:hypothetical protein
MSDNRIQIIESQKEFYRIGTGYVHKWRREITFELLQQFQQKLVNDDAILQTLYYQRAKLENGLSSTLESLKLTEKNEKEAKDTIETLKEDLENEKKMAELKLNKEIESREKEKNDQVRTLDASQAKFELQIEEYKKQIKVMAVENKKLKQISTFAVKYVTEPGNYLGFYGYLASKGIIMEFKVFVEMLEELRKKTADELLVSMGESIFTILDDLDLPTDEKNDEIPHLPQSKVVCPPPFIDVDVNAKDV